MSICVTTKGKHLYLHFHAKNRNKKGKIQSSSNSASVKLSSHFQNLEKKAEFQLPIVESFSVLDRFLKKSINGIKTIRFTEQKDTI